MGSIERSMSASDRRGALPYQKLQRRATALLVSLTALTLSACGASPPKQDISGAPWQTDWVQIGSSMGVEPPEELHLLDNKEALAADGLYYAAWTDGDSRPYTNAEGKEVDLYDAQLYLLLGESGSHEQAEENYEDWLSAARAGYHIDSDETKTYAGQAYTILTYRCNPDTSPYDRGISAFGVTGDSSVCIELTCLADYDGTIEDILTAFLQGCHYAAKEEEE